MKKELHEYYYKIEQTYWWFKGMKAIFYSMLIGIYKKNNSLRILDIGCGTGFFIKELEGFGDVTGIDVEPRALELCKEKVINKLVLGDGAYLPFKDEYFDLVVLFNVIEHIEKEDAIVREIRRVCKYNGRVIIATSAFNFLWSNHDVINHHKRRYTREGLKQLLQMHFDIERITYTNCILFLAVWPCIIFNNLLRNSRQNFFGGFYPLPKIINNILTFILKIEAVLLRKVNFPLGVSLICIAKRRFAD